MIQITKKPPDWNRARAAKRCNLKRVNKKPMEPLCNMMKKRRPSLGDCGVKPVSKDVHLYLIFSYLLWPLTFSLGVSSALKIFCICVAFVVMGFLLYSLLLAMVKMSHDEKKRLKIGQMFFLGSVLILAIRVGWLAG